jgi:hypothetical protein
MDSSTQLTQIPIRIIQEQELVIGPLAWSEADKVNGLDADQASGSVSISGDGKDVVNRLVTQYEKIFGEASHETCKEAVQDIITKMSPEEVPSSLK